MIAAVLVAIALILTPLTVQAKDASTASTPPKVQAAPRTAPAKPPQAPMMKQPQMMQKGKGTRHGMQKGQFPVMPPYKAANIRGVELLRSGKTDEAIVAFKGSLRGKPDFVAARVNLGLAYLDKRKPAEAEKEFRSVIKGDPKCLVARDGLATSFAQRGDYKAAMKEMNEVLRTNPSYGLGHYNIACWQAKLGNKDEAFKSLNAATGYGFRDAAWMEKDPDLASLRTDPRWKTALAAAKKPVTTGFKVREVQAPAKPATGKPGAARPSKPVIK